ncbi:MAG: DUF2062 domain-containing protein [Desulfovermiculus sp.]|nr:DUF2062 domain-containing protein [Desulfovermiculus sp.]
MLRDTLNTSRQRLRLWLNNHPRIKRMLWRNGCLKFQVQTVARGIGVGLFLGLTPTVGAQTLLLVIGCLVLRANLLSAYAVSWISNPFTMMPLYWVFHALGRTLFASFFQFDLFTSELLDTAWRETLYLVLGSLLIAIPASVAGYIISSFMGKYLVQRFQQRKLKKIKSMP